MVGIGQNTIVSMPDPKCGDGMFTSLLIRTASKKQGRSTRTCTRTYSSTDFTVLSSTQYSAKFLSTSTRTYSSTDAKSPVRVLLSTLKILIVKLSKVSQFLSNYLECFFL